MGKIGVLGAWIALMVNRMPGTTLMVGAVPDTLAGGSARGDEWHQRVGLFVLILFVGDTTGFPCFFRSLFVGKKLVLIRGRAALGFVRGGGCSRSSST